MRRTLLSLCLFTGCGIGLDAHETDTQIIEEGEVGIYSVVPSWGHPDEDTVVTLTGWGFEGDMSIQFGNADLQVTRVAEDSVVVTAPAVGFETKVDVKIVSDAGSFKETEGFTYSYTKPNEDTEDTDDTDDTEDTDDTNTGNTGKIGGLVHFIRIQIACKECFGSTEELLIDSFAAFHSPTDQDFLAWQPPLGSCVTNAAPNDVAVTRYDVGPWVYLNSGSTSVGLRKTTGADGTSYTASNLTLDDFISNASYDLSVPDGGELGGAFEIRNAVATPQGFSSIQPYELLLVDPASAFSAPVSMSGTSFSWSPSGGTGSFMMRVDIYDPTGASYLGNVVCLGPDNGSMYIPGGYFSSYSYGSLLAVKMYRQQVEETIIPATGDTLQAVSHGGVWGTAYLSY